MRGGLTPAFLPLKTEQFFFGNPCSKPTLSAIQASSPSCSHPRLLFPRLLGPLVRIFYSQSWSPLAITYWSLVPGTPLVFLFSVFKFLFSRNDYHEVHPLRRFLEAQPPALCQAFAPAGESRGAGPAAGAAAAPALSAFRLSRTSPGS